MRYYLLTFGCQMNWSDSERIAAVLKDMGYSPAESALSADLIVINACSVRQTAIDRIWGQTRKFEALKAENGRLKTILTGCVMPLDKKKFEGVFDLILDIKKLSDLPKLLGKNKAGIESEYLEIKPSYNSKISAVIPIMTGCNNFCTYCAVPFTRGREISRNPKEIIIEAESLVKKGYKEIWLLGQNVNSYKVKGVNFPKLLEKICDISGKFWIRFTSPHPKDFSAELIKVIAKNLKITPYLNLPIQSGDDEILKKMKRPYTVFRYKNLVNKIKHEFLKTRKGLEKTIAISTDIIVGFPGETKKQFQNTAKTFRDLGFSMAYISQYSPRPGTPAAKMKDNITPLEKKRRWEILNEILKKSSSKINEEFLGKEIEVLVEKQDKKFLTGKDRHYKTIKIKIGRKDAKSNFLGRFERVKVTKTFPWGLEARLSE